MTSKVGSGYIVLTKDGRQGMVYHVNGLINGKVPIYFDNDEMPILANPTSFTIIGFFD
jgi:hypothetical protein